MPPAAPFLHALRASLAAPGRRTIAAARRAAVAVVLRVVGEEARAFAAPGGFFSAPASRAPRARIEVLLIERAERAGDPWSGHVAFPGGKREAADADDAAAAAREALEETGVDVRALEFLGALGDRPAYAGGRALPGYAFCAAVWVAPAPFAPRLALQAAEVAAAAWVPLAALDARAVDARGVARPALRGLLGAAAAARVPRWTGLRDAYFPAIEIPAAAFVAAGARDGAPAPPARGAPRRLWGMSLRAASDVVEAGGGRPLAWPPVALEWPWHAGVAAAAGCVELAEVARGARAPRDAAAAHVGAAAAALAAVGAALRGVLL